MDNKNGKTAYLSRDKGPYTIDWCRLPPHLWRSLVAIMGRFYYRSFVCGAKHPHVVAFPPACTHTERAELSKWQKIQHNLSLCYGYLVCKNYLAVDGEGIRQYWRTAINGHATKVSEFTWLFTLCSSWLWSAFLIALLTSASLFISKVSVSGSPIYFSAYGFWLVTFNKRNDWFLCPCYGKLAGKVTWVKTFLVTVHSTNEIILYETYDHVACP